MYTCCALYAWNVSCTQSGFVVSHAGESRMEGRMGRIGFNVGIAIVMVATGTVNTLAAK